MLACPFLNRNVRVCVCVYSSRATSSPATSFSPAAPQALGLHCAFSGLLTMPTSGLSQPDLWAVSSPKWGLKWPLERRTGTQTVQGHCCFLMAAKTCDSPNPWRQQGMASAPPSSPPAPVPTLIPTLEDGASPKACHTLVPLCGTGTYTSPVPRRGGAQLSPLLNGCPAHCLGLRRSTEA